MSLKSFRAYSFKLPLKHPLEIKRQSLSQREGLLLELETEFGVGYGEISPLPDWHSISLETCALQIRELYPLLQNLKITTLDSAQPCWPSFNFPGQLHSHVQFALEMAMFDLAMQDPEFHFSNLLDTSNSQISLPLQALVHLDRCDPQRLEAFQTLKIKIGRQNSLKHELEQIAHYLQKRSTPARLRLDCNQKVSLNQLANHKDLLKEWSIDFIEAPQAQNAALLNYPIAVDEEVSEFWQTHPNLDFIQLSRFFSHIDYFVLKPHALNSLANLWKACKRGFPIILSNTYHSDLFLRLLLLLGQSHPQLKQRAHGLDTQQFFTDGLLKQTPQLQNGCLTYAWECYKKPLELKTQYLKAFL